MDAGRTWTLIEAMSFRPTGMANTMVTSGLGGGNRPFSSHIARMWEGHATEAPADEPCLELSRLPGWLLRHLSPKGEASRVHHDAPARALPPHTRLPSLQLTRRIQEAWASLLKQGVLPAKCECTELGALQLR